VVEVRTVVGRWSHQKRGLWLLGQTVTPTTDGHLCVVTCDVPHMIGAILSAARMVPKRAFLAEFQWRFTAYERARNAASVPEM
jgi:hypothetical protein